MKNDYVFNYKNEKSMSFLTVGVDDPARFVHYQVKMMENNSIPILLPMSVSEHNGSYELFYDITSRLSLEQILSRRRLNEDQCLKLIEAFASALEELPEYQLSAGGMIIDPSYIFVRTGDFDVSFVFIPDGSEESGIEEIRNCLSVLVMKNRVAAGSGDFISALLTILNTEKLDAELLKKFCKDCRNKGQGGRRPIYGDITDDSKDPYDSNGAYNRNKVDEPLKTPPHRTENKGGKSGIALELPKNGGKKKNLRNPDRPKASSEKKSIGKRIFFILIQGVFIVLAGLAVQKGLIIDSDGKIDIATCSGILLIFVLLDFLIFRRLFNGGGKSSDDKKGTKNKKEKDLKDRSKDKKKEDKSPTQPSGRSLAKPPFGSGGATDSNGGKKNQKSDQTRHQKITPVNGDNNTNYNGKQNIGNINDPVNYDDRSRTGMPDNNNIYRKPPSQDNGADYDMTVVMDDVYSNEARFTWYVNGMAHRVKMRGNDMIAGRQKDRVDIFIQSRMVGHIHAEFRLRADGEYTVTDCNSKNGTYINGSPTRIASNKEYVIHNGDIIRLADTELTFEC